VGGGVAIDDADLLNLPIKLPDAVFDIKIYKEFSGIF
jgi:hypothetical protein